MKVDLRELPTHRSIEIDAAFVGSSLAGLPLRAALEAPADDPDAGAGTATFDFFSDANEEDIFARGSLRGWMQVACSRCVEPVRIELDESIHATFLPRAKAPKDEELGDPEADDVDLYAYDGDEIDLEPMLREQYVLAVPYAPLCKEDCAGLCNQCGQNLNVAACGCEAPIDPRLAALKAIKV